MPEPSENVRSPGQLALRLGAYYVLLLVALVSTVQLWPEAFQYLPFGGRDALEGSATEHAIQVMRNLGGSDPAEAARTIVDATAVRVDRVAAIQTILLFVVGHLAGTILLMLPIAWTYSAINFETGYRRNFLRALIVLPLCATTVVLLVQDSLALAFGLAALVAAVRFRVALDEAMDGIYIFAAIAVGLAAGIGYLGVALVMSLFFCAANVVMWAKDFGRNPVDDARLARRRAKFSSASDKPTDG